MYYRSWQFKFIHCLVMQIFDNVPLFDFRNMDHYTPHCLLSSLNIRPYILQILAYKK
uniref:Uncharacterized protein n=1 Tax=Arundo donax TaxID=35708 RepID=A0A0A9DDN2_ARUDO